MALDAGQIAYADSYLGAGGYDATDLEARLTRTGSLGLAVRELVAAKLASFAMNPAAITIPGEYAENHAANLAALDALLATLPVPPAAPGETGRGYAGRLVRTDRR